MQQGSSLPPEVYRLVEQTPASVLLESAARRANALLFVHPLRTLEARTAGELRALLRALDEAAAAGL